MPCCTWVVCNKCTTVWAPTKKLLISWQFSGPYGVTKYGSGWRRDVVNQCLEFAATLWAFCTAVCDAVIGWKHLGGWQPGLRCCDWLKALEWLAARFEMLWLAESAWVVGSQVWDAVIGWKCMGGWQPDLRCCDWLKVFGWLATRFEMLWLAESGWQPGLRCCDWLKVHGWLAARFEMLWLAESAWVVGNQVWDAVIGWKWLAARFEMLRLAESAWVVGSQIWDAVIGWKCIGGWQPVLCVHSFRTQPCGFRSRDAGQHLPGGGGQFPTTARVSADVRPIFFFTVLFLSWPTVLSHFMSSILFLFCHVPFLILSSLVYCPISCPVSVLVLLSCPISCPILFVCCLTSCPAVLSHFLLYCPVWWPFMSNCWN